MAGVASFRQSTQLQFRGAACLHANNSGAGRQSVNDNLNDAVCLPFVSLPGLGVSAWMQSNSVSSCRLATYGKKMDCIPMQCNQKPFAVRASTSLISWLGGGERLHHESVTHFPTRPERFPLSTRSSLECGWSAFDFPFTTNTHQDPFAGLLLWPILQTHHLESNPRIRSRVATLSTPCGL